MLSKSELPIVDERGCLSLGMLRALQPEWARQIDNGMDRWVRQHTAHRTATVASATDMVAYSASALRVLRISWCWRPAWRLYRGSEPHNCAAASAAVHVHQGCRPKYNRKYSCNLIELKRICKHFRFSERLRADHAGGQPLVRFSRQRDCRTLEHVPQSQCGAGLGKHT